MKLKNYAILLSACAMLASCVSDDPWKSESRGARGSIDLLLTASGELITGTRAQTIEIDVPDAEDFGIHLTQTSGGDFDKIWNNLEAFRVDNEEGFPVGTYDLEAFYGTPDDQGLDSPYFTGHTEITIAEATQTSVELCASLGNGIVRVTYGDGFKKYFTSWSTELQTEGHPVIDLGMSEGEMIYVIPGDVQVIMNATNQNHQSVRLNPASIPVEAGHKYRVNYEVYNGEIGEAQLTVSFDDTLEAEDVVINLAEELFEVSPPVVLPDGFTNEQLFEMLEGAVIDTPLQFDVFAPGVMASCVLEFTKIQGDYIPPFGTAVELINAGETVQQQLSEAGVRCLGFFHNPDRMGVIDVTDFCRTLPQGHYEISVRVTDKHGNINERVYFGISTEPVEISAVAAPIQIGATTADITITYNGTPPTGPGNNPFTFEAQGDLGYKPVDIVSINGAEYTRASEARDYVYRITLAENSTDKIGVRIFYNNKERVSTTVDVEVPEYGITVDAFANRAYVRIDGLEAQTVAGMYRYMKFDVNDVVLSADAVNYDSATGFIELSGLTPNTSCTLKSLVFDTERASAQFSTEPAQDVPNGDFSQTEQTINLTDVQVGGQYRVSPVDYTLKSSIVIDEPIGWASVNAKTAYIHAANKNTWFIVPSTLAQNGEVTLRSVAYDHNGVTPSKSGGAFNTAYYCENAPASIASRAAGELFLGSYAFEGSALETRIDGIDFVSRPTSLSFDYRYTPYGSEVGVALIALYDASGNVLFTQEVELDAQTDMTHRTININPAPFSSKVAKLVLNFKSTKGNQIGVTIPSGSDLNEHQSLGNHTLSANSYHALATGSELIIDNVHLNY